MRPIHTSSYPTPGAETSEIAGVSVCIGDHVVLNLSPFPQPIEGQVTDLNQEYIEINKVPYQRIACISVTQLDLTNGINFVNLIKHLENSPEAFLDAFEISQGDVFTCLKAVRNSLEIQITLFNALEIPNFSPLDNLKSLEVLLKEKTQLFQHISTLTQAQNWLNAKIDQHLVQQLTTSLQEK